MRIVNSHEISYLICLKKGKILNCYLLQIIGGALWVKLLYVLKLFLHSTTCIIQNLKLNPANDIILLSLLKQMVPF